ncbi:glutathionylspermidine synthase family protein [Paenibacillus sp. WLX1005]|uniref:glutathionylspermidine synthase family protein n=1 Tax=Paenibacillus sp. WLX1005 TaxID=3243766 RepID=UPI0039841378
MRQTRNLQLSREVLFSGEVAEVVPYHIMYDKPYCLSALTLYTSHEYEQLALGSQRVHQLYRKTLRFVQQHLPEPYLIHQLGLHPLLAALATEQIDWDGITRLDWIISPNGDMKCIENNTDTPSGIPEVAYLEGKLLQYAPDLRPASAQMDECIREMFLSAVYDYRQRGLGGILYMTSYDWHDEDRMNTLYLLEQCKRAGIDAVYVPLEQLRIVPGDGLFYEQQKIELLYRLYPLEYLVEDREEDSGRTVGEDLLHLVADGKLGLINPVQHMITQSKGFLATLWSLYERNDQMAEQIGFTLFTEEECQWIERYMLPTYFTPEPFILADIPYVSKGFFGREGQGTKLIQQPQLQGEPVAETVDRSPSPQEQAITETQMPSAGASDSDPTDRAEDEAAAAIAAYYEHQLQIYQQLQPMEPVCAQTVEGDFDGYLLTGAFVIGGQFAGLLPRIGGKVTDNLACYCAAAILP